jgi:hypothetical protein
VSSSYDFVGNVLRTREFQEYGSVERSVDTYFSYDHRGRLLKVEKQVDNGSGLVEDEPKQTLAEMSYNELGQLIDKNLHGGIDGVRYIYNIRGWLKSMNSNKFLIILERTRLMPLIMMVFLGLSLRIMVVEIVFLLGMLILVIN